MFRGLAYTDHVHYDAEREKRLAGMPEFVREMVRMIGWHYAGDLAEIATWVQAIGREEPATSHLFKPLPVDG